MGLVKKCCCTLLSVSFCQTSLATNDLDLYDLQLDQLMNMTVTAATGTLTRLAHTPASASVITASQIKTMGAQQLSEVLATVPGFHIGTSTIIRMQDIYSIRGIYTPTNAQVLILVDNQPFKDTYTSAKPDLFRLPVSMIDRIEIIRGPGSALYGADAYAGVVHIHTKAQARSEQNSISLGGRYGSFETRELWSNARTNQGSWQLSANFSYQRTEGDDKRIIPKDQQTLFDQLLGSNASLAPGPLNTSYKILFSNLALQNQHSSIGVSYWKNETGQGVGGSTALDPKGQLNQDFITVYGQTAWQISPDNELQFNLRYQRTDLQAKLNLFPPGTRLPIGADGNINFVTPINTLEFTDGYIGNPGNLQTGYHSNLTLLNNTFENHQLRMEAGAFHQQLETNESKNFGPGVLTEADIISGNPVSGELTRTTDTAYIYMAEQYRNVVYASLQDQWRISDQWQATLGLRFDHYSDVGDTLNPRLALVWNHHQDTVKLLYGSAFRAPSMSELSIKNNPVILGNEQLEPERLDMLELHYHHQFSRALISQWSLFHYRAVDMISYQPHEGGARAQNGTQQKGYGLEWENHWTASDNLFISGHYSWQFSTSNNRQAANTPEHMFYIKADWQLSPRWSVFVQNKWISELTRSPMANGNQDPRPAVDPYSISDMYILGKNLIPGLELGFKVTNVFDHQAYAPAPEGIPGDYPLQGRAWYLSANYRWQD